MDHLNPYTIGFGVAVREIASGETSHEAARVAATELTPGEFCEYVHGYTSAYEIDRHLNEGVSK